MHRTKNTSKKRRTHRGVITFPADAAWPSLSSAIVQENVTDPHMTATDLVVLNPTSLVAGVTVEASVATTPTPGVFQVVCIITNVSGAQMVFPGMNVRYGILPS